jgi:hypothetical protein
LPNAVSAIVIAHFVLLRTLSLPKVFVLSWLPKRQPIVVGDLQRADVAVPIRNALDANM